MRRVGQGKPAAFRLPSRDTRRLEHRNFTAEVVKNKTSRRGAGKSSRTDPRHGPPLLTCTLIYGIKSSTSAIDPPSLVCCGLGLAPLSRRGPGGLDPRICWSEIEEPGIWAPADHAAGVGLSAAPAQPGTSADLWARQSPRRVPHRELQVCQHVTRRPALSTSAPHLGGARSPLSGKLPPAGGSSQPARRCNYRWCT